MGADANHHFLRFGGIAERIFSPPVALPQDLRGDSQARHRRVRCENHHRASSFARGAGEPHRLCALGLEARDDDERETSAAEELLRSTEPVLPIPRSHEDRPLFPEWTGDGAESIDPDRSLALGDGGVTRCAQHRGRSTLRHPDGEPSTRKTMSGKNCIEYLDARRHRLCGPMGDRCRIRKSMLDEGADGGVAVRHSSARIPRTYTESKKRAGKFDGDFARVV